MNQERPTALDAVLDADDAELLFAARLEVGTLDPVERAHVRRLLAEWQDDHGLANLLMCPELIPADLRTAALLKGAANHTSYLALAAAVGLQQVAELDADVHADEQRVLSALRELTRCPDPIIAARAEVALFAWTRFDRQADVPLPSLAPIPSRSEWEVEAAARSNVATVRV